MRRVVLLAVVGLMMLTGTRVSAQTQTPASSGTPNPGRLYRGLFGSSKGNSNWQQSLVFRAGLGTGYDWGLYPGGRTTTTGQVSTNGLVSSEFHSGSVGLDYSLSRTRVGLSAAVNASGSYYPSLSRPTLASYRGGVAGSIQLWSGAHLQINHIMALQPFYELAWLSGQPNDPQAGPLIYANQGFSGLFESHFRSSSQMSFSQQLGRRLGFSTAYDIQRSHSSSQAYDFVGQGGRAGLSYAIGRGLGLRAGYTEAEYRFGAPGSPAYRAQNFDGGLDFSRALSFSRGATTLSFSTGLAAVQSGLQRHYNVTGNAALSRDLRRTWSARLDYDRGFSFDESFGVPVQSDRVDLRVGGLVNRRLSLNSMAGAVRGGIGFGPSNNFQHYFARSGAVVALSRHLGLGLDYSYFAYRYDPGIVVPIGPVGLGHRQVVRVSLNLWAPIFQQRGKTHVTG